MRIEVLSLACKLQRFTRHQVLIINHSLTKIIEFKGITVTLRKFIVSEFGEHIATILTT